MDPRQCEHCSTVLDSHRKFCNTTCKNRFVGAQNALQTKLKNEQKPNIKCEHCSVEFKPKHLNAKFCSKSCTREHSNAKLRDNSQKEREKSENKGEYISCAICGFLSNSLQIHIVGTHKLSLEEYTKTSRVGVTAGFS